MINEELVINLRKVNELTEELRVMRAALTGVEGRMVITELMVKTT